MVAPKTTQLYAEKIDLATALQSATLKLLGDKLSLMILLRLADGPQRFGELQEMAKNTSSKTVSDRLKRLESAGIVTKTLYAVIPPKTIYQLTGKGQELVALINGLAEWEASWTKQ